MKNILFISKYYYPHIGGVEKHISNISRILTKNNKVTIITERFNNSLQCRETLYDVDVIRINYPKIKYMGLLLIWLRMLMEIKLFIKSDVIHIHDVFIWFLPFALLMRKKVYITFHGGQDKWPIPWHHKYIVKLSSLFSKGNISVGNFIPKYFGIQTNYIIYGGVEKVNKHKLKKEKLIIFLGRLEKVTGVYEFLKKVKRYNDFTIMFIGDGSLRHVCEKFGRVTGFTDPVPFLKKASICFAAGYLAALESLSYDCNLWVDSNTPIKNDYWKYFPYKKGDKLPDWNSVAKIYLDLWGLDEKDNKKNKYK